jgi:hypothetical protein
MIYIPSLVKDRMSHSELIGWDTQTRTNSMIISAAFFFFQNRESRLIKIYPNKTWTSFTWLMSYIYALSDERTGLSFIYCQRSLSRVRVSWDSRPYFTVSDLRLPFSSPPTTRRVTVEVFDPASTQGELSSLSFWLVLPMLVHLK